MDPSTKVFSSLACLSWEQADPSTTNFTSLCYDEEVRSRIFGRRWRGRFMFVRSKASLRLRPSLGAK